MYATIPNKKIVHYSDSVFGYHKLKNGNLRNIYAWSKFWQWHNKIHTKMSSNTSPRPQRNNATAYK